MKTKILTAGLLLLIFSAISIFFVALVEESTREKIKINEQNLLVKRLKEIINNYDNDIIAEKVSKKITIHGTEQIIDIYKAKTDNITFAYLIEHTYPNGYSGNIKLLTAINTSNKLLGVRVITHKETPGLGDKIETNKSNWIKQFSGLSLFNPTVSQWKVKRDGGVFDSFTGATITPRAVVNSTYEILQYFHTHEISKF